MSFIYGVFGAALIIAVFIGGVVCGRKLERSAAPARESEADRPLTEAEERERERLIAEQKAFRVMMSYNADMAYNGPAAADDDSDEVIPQ